MPNDVRWIHITTDMFSDEKIKVIQNMPDADALIVIWVKLICHAGKINDDGWIYLDKEIPYTEEELAAVLDRPVNTIRLALTTFKRLRMIELNENGIYLINFAKNQSIDGLARVRENTRKRVASFRAREKMKLLKAPDNDRNVTVTNGNVTCNPTEKKREEYIREEKESFNKWNNVLDILKSNVTPANYRTWLEETIGIDVTEDEFIIGVKDDFRVNYLENNMRGLIEKAIYQEFQKELKPRFVLVGM